jgi:hypothetical protein
MVDGTLPVRPGQGLTLRIGDGHEGQVAEIVIKRREIGKVKPAVKRGYTWRLFAAAQGEVQIVNMRMNKVEVAGLAEYFFHHQDVMDHRVDAIGIKPQCFPANRN